MIYNDANDQVPADFWYNFTYQLTYLYLNWTGPIRVPMVLQNAHKLAKKASEARADYLHEDLKTTMILL